MIKNIVFDLDGTLWQTKDSYIYAYKKLCEKYQKTPINGFEDVLNYMGVKVDILLKELFPEIIEQKQIICEALFYSIEYIINNSSGTCYDNVNKILKDLSEEYNIYIISNCLKEYVETFLNISNTSDYISGFYTIELGEKSEHLNKITNNYRDKTIFVGDDLEDYNQIDDHSIVYFIFATYGYKKCNLYDYKINELNDIYTVLKEVNKKERILCENNYEIISNNDTNITLIRKNDHLYYFGFLNIGSNDDLKIVINKMIKRVNDCRIIGPIDGNTYYSYRMAIDSFDWILYPDIKNSKEQFEIFINNGFKIKQQYSSTLANINEKIYLRSKKYKLTEEYSVKVVEGNECYNYVNQLYDVAVESFNKADYYEKINQKDFEELYLENLKLCVPDLVLIYYKKELIAFNFSYEDLEKRFYVSKTTAIKPNFQNSNILMTLIYYSYQLMINKGYKQVLYHFQNDRTKTLQAIHKGYGIKTKKYALLEYINEKTEM